MQRPDGAKRFTFRGNLRETRHGWLRLTPAYSLHLVRDLASKRARPELPVLDPFCGTGTTLLACAELGVPCETVELNPFLVWLARAKVARYDEPLRRTARDAVRLMAARASKARGEAGWVPPLHRIERWWDAATLAALSRAFAALESHDAPPRARDLAKLSFCRALISTSNASFRHQSMSFKDGRAPSARAARDGVAKALEEAFATIERAAAEPLPGRQCRAHLGDSRDVAAAVASQRFGTVITSPPYANRMSYIRELRPYMYWLGYLADGRAAGELDWRAIGGTWGSATSKLGTWQADPAFRPKFPGYSKLLGQIEDRSPILSRYVHRYFTDMQQHLTSLKAVLGEGASVHYVVGNSKFFDTLLPVEKILAAMMSDVGLGRPRIETLRKRTSKPELLEFCVSARLGE